MGTEILRPQDCFIRVGGGPSTTSLILPRSRNRSTNSSSSYYNSSPGTKVYRKTDQRKQQYHQSGTSTAAPTILRRGESLCNINSNRKETGNPRLKKSVSGNLRNLRSGFSSSSSGSESSSDSEMYAGNAFCSSSPAPSSLPLPTFSVKKESSRCGLAVIDNLATKDLRRLLRLD